MNIGELLSPEHIMEATHTTYAAYVRAMTKYSDAFYDKCDKETTTLTDIILDIVNINVGFAPLTQQFYP